MFLIHDGLKWVGTLGWDIQLGGGVVIGGSLGENLPRLKSCLA